MYSEALSTAQLLILLLALDEFNRILRQSVCNSVTTSDLILKIYIYFFKAYMFLSVGVLL